MSRLIVSVVLLFALPSFTAAHALGQKSVAQDRTGLFEKALQRHVKDGLVNYEAMAKDQDFRDFLGWLKKADATSFEAETDEMAFWINAYNALAIKGVLDNYPLKRVIDVPGFFDQQKHAVAGAEFTLNQIEKEIIFKKFKEPRLHFVLVCAAASCPSLPSRAYTGETVLEKMAEVGRLFLNNPKTNRLDRENRVMRLSQIFNWYESDFKENERTVLQYVLPFFNHETRAFLAENDVTVAYLEYDWALNAQQ